MKKTLVLLIVVALCAAIALPVAAAASGFVPSITYKGGPFVVAASLETAQGAETVLGCVVTTSIEQAREKSTDVSQEDRDLLLEVYEALESGEMVLPIEGEYVIRDLIDVSFEYADCRLKPEHNDKPAALKQEGVVLNVKFDMGMQKGTDLVVMTYIDEKWQEIESVEINADGTVVCVFEDICPVAFAVKG